MNKEKKKRESELAVPWSVRLARIHDELELKWADIAARIGSSPRTLEGWRLGYHEPDRRAQGALLPLWREAKAARRARLDALEGDAHVD